MLRPNLAKHTKTYLVTPLKSRGVARSFLRLFCFYSFYMKILYSGVFMNIYFVKYQTKNPDFGHVLSLTKESKRAALIRQISMVSQLITFLNK